MARRRTVTVPFFISHKGCPHRCIFCDQQAISGAAGELPTPVEISRRIDDYLATAAGRSVEVAFFGGSFTMLPVSDQAMLLDAVQPYLGDGRVTGIRISTRPDAISPDIASRLAAAGVATVELGVQSLNDAVLLTAERGHDSSAVVAAVRCLQIEELAVGLQLMPGLPGQESENAIAEAIAALSLFPSFLRIYPALVLRGTKLETLYQAGSYLPWSLDQAVEVCASILREALRAKVPVIRIGLQPTEELESAGTIVAGPYHPAFRELVEGALRRRALIASLKASADPATVYCPPRELSFFTGHGGHNISLLVEKGFSQVSFRPDPALTPYSFRLEQSNRTTHVDVLEVQ